MFDGRQELGAALSSQKRPARRGAPTSVTDFPTRGESPGGRLTLIPHHEASKPQKITIHLIGRLMSLLPNAARAAAGKTEKIAPERTCRICHVIGEKRRLPSPKIAKKSL